MKCHQHPEREAVGVCSTCGNGVCAECRREFAGAVRCPVHATSTSLAASTGSEKSGFWTVVLSFLPGLGHIYLGAYQRGIVIGLIFAALCALNARDMGGMEPFSGLATAFVWFFGIIDAMRIRRAINTGASVELASSPGILTPAIPKKSSRAASLTWGIILTGIGVLWLADKYFELDRFLDFVHDNIGLVFLAVGVILIISYSRSRARQKEQQLSLTTPAPPANSGSSGQQ
jgi:hypothetical protein